MCSRTFQYLLLKAFKFYKMKIFNFISKKLLKQFPIESEITQSTSEGNNVIKILRVAFSFDGKLPLHVIRQFK